MKFSLSALFLLLTACGPQGPATIDGSTDETLAATLEAARAQLPPEEQARFDEALATIAWQIAATYMLTGIDEEAVGTIVRSRLHGKNPADIIAEAERLAQESEEKQRAQDAAHREREAAEEQREAQRALERAEAERREMAEELATLLTREAEAAAARETLEKFRILSAGFFWTENPVYPQPAVRMTVRNELDTPISRAFFEGTLATPSRSVPWLQEPFNYGISGGLEPGEEAEWNLSAGYDWRSAPRDRDDMVLTITTTRLDGPDGETLARIDPSAVDPRRIAFLREQLEISDEP